MVQNDDDADFTNACTHPQAEGLCVCWVMMCLAMVYGPSTTGTCIVALGSSLVLYHKYSPNYCLFKIARPRLDRFAAISTTASANLINPSKLTKQKSNSI